MYPGRQPLKMNNGRHNAARDLGQSAANKCNASSEYPIRSVCPSFSCLALLEAAVQ